MSINEADVKKISGALGEQAFFTELRAQALKESLHLPEQTLKYGQGITSSPGDEKKAAFEEGAVRYNFSPKNGAQIFSWSEAMKNEETSGLLKKYFIPENVPVLKNRYFAESLAAFGSGLAVVIPNGAKDVIVEVSSMVEKSGADFVFIIAKSGSSSHIFETIGNTDPYFFGRTFFVVAEEGSHVEITSIQGMVAESVFFENRFSYIARGGHVKWYDIHAGGGFVKTDTEDFLRGEGAQSHSRNISLCANQLLDIYNASHHVSSYTTSHISARGIAGSGSKIIYRGLVDVPKGVSGVVGRQEGRFLIVSTGAEIDAIPGLDIANNEVISSHALSISHLKDENFFFPALRGVPPYRAQAMLLTGFLTKPLNELPETFGKEVEFFVSKKLATPLFRMD